MRVAGTRIKASRSWTCIAIINSTVPGVIFGSVYHDKRRESVLLPRQIRDRQIEVAKVTVYEPRHKTCFPYRFKNYGTAVKRDTNLCAGRETQRFEYHVKGGSPRSGK